MTRTVLERRCQIFSGVLSEASIDPVIHASIHSSTIFDRFLSRIDNICLHRQWIFDLYRGDRQLSTRHLSSGIFI